MAPPPLATAAAASRYPEEIFEVRCVGCRETLDVERGLTEFVCPDCGTAQSLPPELMPPPKRRALPMPRGAADARVARLPCAELLSVPVGLSRCACPFCGAELAVDCLRNYILSSAAAAVVVPLPAASVSPIAVARETWQTHPSYATHAGLPQTEPNVRLIPVGRAQMQLPNHTIHVHRNEQEYPDDLIDGEEISVANETVTNNNLQKNQLSPGSHVLGNKERQDLPPNEVRNHVNDQHPSHTVQPKRSQLARVRRVIHSEEIQEGPPTHEVYREAGRTELIYETSATHKKQRVGCFVGPQSLSAEEKHMETSSQIVQQVHKHPYHESHAMGKHIGCLDMNGVLHPPFNQANHGQEASTEMISETLARERSIGPTVCSVGPNSVSVEKRNQVKQKMQKQQSDVTRAEDTQQEHPDQAVQEPINHTTQKEAMSSLPIKETTARSSKQNKSQFVYSRTVAKKRHIEPVNHPIPQAKGQTSESDCQEIQVDFERPSKGNERHGSTSTLKEQEQVMLNKLSDLKQKNVRTNEIQKEKIEVDVSKQTSGWTQKKKSRKDSMGSLNAGLQLRQSKGLTKDSVPSVAMEDEPMEWGPLQRRSASPDCEVSVATADTESVEGEHDEVSAAMADTESVESEDDEHYAASPDESMSASEPPDIDRRGVRCAARRVATGAEKRKVHEANEAIKQVPLQQSDSVVHMESENQGICVEKKRSKSSSCRILKRKKKGLTTASNSGLQLRRSKCLANVSSATITNSEPTESDPDEQHAGSPDQSLSDSPDIDRIINNVCPSPSPLHEESEPSSNELDSGHLTTHIDLSDPEQFALDYIPPEVKKALANLGSNSLFEHTMSQASSGESDSEGDDPWIPTHQNFGTKGNRRPRNFKLDLKMWTLPKGVRIPVSLNISGEPVGKEAGTLSSFLCALARDGVLAPLIYQDWRRVPEKNKDIMWRIVKALFICVAQI